MRGINHTCKYTIAAALVIYVALMLIWIIFT